MLNNRYLTNLKIRYKLVIVQTIKIYLDKVIITPKLTIVI